MSANAPGIFEGVRILEFGRAVAGPYAAELFAHGGADVVKIEPIEGDFTRSNSTIIPGEGRHYIIKARGKRGVPINLRHPQGEAIARRLALRSDVLVSNMRPGALGRHGLDYESLSAEEPRIIVAEISAFGNRGPYGGLGGADFQASAASGLMMSTANFDEEVPRFADAFLADTMAGSLLAFAIASALYSRERTGRGQHVTTSLYQAGLALQHATANLFDAVDLWKRDFADWIQRERPHPREASERRRAQTAVLIGGLYPTADGRWITLGSNQVALTRLLDALNLDDDSVSDPDWEMPDDPSEHFTDLRSRIAAVVKTRNGEELRVLLQDRGVACSLLETLEEAILSEHAHANGFVYEADHPVVGPMIMPGAPVSFSRGRYEPGDRTPAYGEHVREVLGELDFSNEEIDQLIADQAVGERLP